MAGGDGELNKITLLSEQVVNQIFRYIPRSKLTPDEWDSSRIISHRGCVDLNNGIHENTIAAFDKSLQIGCWGMEFDVQWTRDNVPVVIHDPHTGRLPGAAPVEIGAVDCAELRRFCPLVPTLEEVLERYGGKTHLMIEIKRDTVSESAFKLIHAYLAELEPTQDYHLMSLNAEVLNRVKNIPYQAKLMIAITNTKSAYSQFKQGKFGGFTGHYILLNRRIRKELAKENIPWGTGFVNSVNVLAREIRSGTKWIFSDAAEELVKARV